MDNKVLKTENKQIKLQKKCANKINQKQIDAIIFFRYTSECAK